MNNTAKSLGLTETFYANVHGLNNKFNKSSANNVCKLGTFILFYLFKKAMHCLKLEEFVLLVSTPNYIC